jgi:thiamine pyrophosphokinase
VRTIIAAGGVVPDQGETIRRGHFAAADLVIAADSGIVCCVQHGIWPDVLIGDLDSAPAAMVAEAENRGVEVMAYPTDKAATDLELAIELAVDRGSDEVEVIAPFGARLDHELANIALMASDRWVPKTMSGHDGLRSLFVVRDSWSGAEAPGTSATLLPWQSDATGVVTSGLRWPLAGETLRLGETRGVSNVCDDAVQSVSVDLGPLLVIIHRGP